MLQDALKMRGDRKKIVDQMNEITKKGEAMTPDDLETYAKLDTSQGELKAKIDAIEKSDTLDKEMRAKVERRAAPRGISPDEQTEAESDQRAAFGRYLRNGINGITPEDRTVITGMRQNFDNREIAQLSNALTGVDLSQGGVLVPNAWRQEIISAEKAFGGMIDDGVCYQFETDSGAELPIPTDDDTSNKGQYLGTNVATPEGTPKFGSVRMQAYILSSLMVRVPYALLQDSAFDLEAFLAGKFGERLGRGANDKFTNGTGSSQPNGLVNAATIGRTASAGAVASIAYSDLIKLKHSVDPAYRRKAPKWMFHDTTFQAIKLLVDGVGRPLWNSGIATKSPDTIDGDPFVINQDMPVMAANALSIAYGAFSKYYIRRVKQMVLMQLRERYAEQFQIAFIAFERNDGNLMDAGTHPIKLYQNSAS